MDYNDIGVVILAAGKGTRMKSGIAKVLHKVKEAVNQSKVTVLATDVDDPAGYGRMILDTKGNLVSIREQADASEEEKKIKKINAGIYIFDTKFLTFAISELKPDNNQAEYYLTDVVGIARNKNQKMSVVTMDDPSQVIGVNTLDELSRAECLIRKMC